VPLQKRIAMFRGSPSAGLAGTYPLQTFLTAAFNAGKDIQQPQDVGVKGPIGVKLREGEEFTQETKKDFCEKIKGRL